MCICWFKIKRTITFNYNETNPGGYAGGTDSLEQFTISDERCPRDVAKMLSMRGYEPVWKDWDVSYNLKNTTAFCQDSSSVKNVSMKN